MNPHYWDFTMGACTACGLTIQAFVGAGINAPACAPPPTSMGSYYTGIVAGFDPGADLEAVPRPEYPPAESHRRCISCEREWCEALDAYYGPPDQWPEKDQCVDCRLGRRPPASAQ